VDKDLTDRAQSETKVGGSKTTTVDTKATTKRCAASERERFPKEKKNNSQGDLRASRERFGEEMGTSGKLFATSAKYGEVR
jgi:hypothetical protein